MLSEEKELLRGKLTGIFNKPPVVLTTKRLILGERSINLGDILEVYAKQERLASKLIIRLRNGTTEECKICPENTISTLTLFVGSMGDQESEMRANFKTTTDRWINLINRVLASTPIT